MTRLRWAWLMLHTPDDALADKAFHKWAALTATTISPPRGERGQYVTFLPQHGDAWLKAQKVLAPSPLHLDLVVDDVDAAAEEAVALGATRVASYDQVRVLRSPGRFTFCFTSYDAEGRPAEQFRDCDTLLDQVCFDIPPSKFEAEAEFWSAITGLPLHHRAGSSYASLERPDSIPLRFLFQRLDSEEPWISAHPDFACRDRVEATRIHVDAGARVIAEHDRWTVLHDSLRGTYCLTDRDPETGLLG